MLPRGHIYHVDRKCCIFEYLVNKKAWKTTALYIVPFKNNYDCENDVQARAFWPSASYATDVTQE